MRSFFPNTLDILHKNLDLRQRRHAFVTSNIANAETPGYIAKDISFEEAFRQAVKPSDQGALHPTHAKHLPNSSRSIHTLEGRVVATASDDVGNDLNTVSIDQEMARLAMNTFHYNASAEIMSRMLSLLKYTVSEGR